MRDRLPMIVSITALLVALFGITPLGEAAYDAVVPRNSVGTLQLQRNAVKAAKIAPSAIRTGHVLDGSLLSADFKAGQIPQGPEGRQGRPRRAGCDRGQRIRDRDDARHGNNDSAQRQRFLSRREAGARGRRPCEHLGTQLRSVCGFQQPKRRGHRVGCSDGISQRQWNCHGDGVRRLRHRVLDEECHGGGTAAKGGVEEWA